MFESLTIHSIQITDTLGGPSVPVCIHPGTTDQMVLFPGIYNTRPGETMAAGILALDKPCGVRERATCLQWSQTGMNDREGDAAIMLSIVSDSLASAVFLTPQGNHLFLNYLHKPHHRTQ